MGIVDKNGVLGVESCCIYKESSTDHHRRRHLRCVDIANCIVLCDFREIQVTFVTVASELLRAGL